MRAWILFALTACTAPHTEPEPLVGWIDGEPYPIAKAWVYSRDNDNLAWAVVLASARGFPSTFSGDLAAVHADFGGASHGFTGIGGDPWNTYFELVTDRAGADECARGLGVPARPRVDPKLLVAARLEVPEAPSTPRTVRFVIENRGRKPFSFLSGGERGTPQGDPRFELQAFRDGAALPALPHPPEFGGMRIVRTLAPGEACAYELELAQWAMLGTPGRCELRARCELEIQPPPRPAALGHDEAHLRWCLAASASCDFRVD